MKKLFDAIIKASSEDSSIKVKVGKTESGNRAIRIIGIKENSVDDLSCGFKKVIMLANRLKLSINLHQPTSNNPFDLGNFSSREGILTVYENSIHRFSNK